MQDAETVRPVTRTGLNAAEIGWDVDGIRVAGTLTLPAGSGPHAAVIFVAGSRPTDRDWNSPLLPGKNGSAALLAAALTEAGFVDRGGKGSHRNFVHSRVAKPITISGKLGDDAKQYQLRAVRAAIEEAQE